MQKQHIEKFVSSAVEQCFFSRWSCFIIVLSFVAFVLCLKGCDPNISGSCLIQKPTHQASITDQNYQMTACRSYCHLYNDRMAEMRQSICPDSSSELRNQGPAGLQFTVTVNGSSGNACHQWLATKASCDEYDSQYYANMPFPREFITYNAKSGKCNLITTSKTFWWIGVSFFCLALLIIICKCVKYCVKHVRWDVSLEPNLDLQIPSNGYHSV